MSTAKKTAQNHGTSTKKARKYLKSVKSDKEAQRIKKWFEQERKGKRPIPKKK